MQQSNVIVGALFIAFFVFITAKGELPTYISLLQGVKPAGTSGLALGTQETSIGTLPTSIDGAQVIVLPKANTIEQGALNEATQSYGIYLPSSQLQATY